MLLALPQSWPSAIAAAATLASAAVVLLAACHDIVVCQRCLGHSNVATTMRYVGMGRDADVTAVLAVA